MIDALRPKMEGGQGLLCRASSNQPHVAPQCLAASKPPVAQKVQLCDSEAGKHSFALRRRNNSINATRLLRLTSRPIFTTIERHGRRHFSARVFFAVVHSSCRSRWPPIRARMCTSSWCVSRSLQRSSIKNCEANGVSDDSSPMCTSSTHSDTL